MFADSIYGQRQYIRALKYYKSAVELVIKAPSPAKVAEYDIRYKMALCYVNARKPSLAISHLEVIPANVRTLAMHLTLGRLYKESGGPGRDRSAIKCFQAALLLCPLCIEAVIAIKELDEDPEPTIAMNLKSSHTANATIDSSWITLVAQAQVELKRNQPQKSLFILKRLEQKFSGNLYLIERLALSYLFSDEPSIINTINTFQKLRQIDAYYIGSMDVYCALLKRRQLQYELNKVCHEMVNASPHCPESWTSVALYYYLRDNNEKALENVDRAISIRETHAYAHSLRGEIFLALEEPKDALPSLERAFQLSKNILTARELVRCHLFLNQLGEALAVAQAIHRMSPDYSKSMALVGMVLANQPEERGKARKILQEALALAPYCIDSILTLSKLDLVEGKTQEAIDLLQKQLEYQETDLMHTEMANIYVTKLMYDDAMRHYNAALEINPQYDAAKTGLDRLIMLIKGIDPDQEDIDDEDVLDDDDVLDEEDEEDEDLDDIEDIIEDIDE
eukprot:gene13339-15688_t